MIEKRRNSVERPHTPQINVFAGRVALLRRESGRSTKTNLVRLTSIVIVAAVLTACVGIYNREQTTPSQASSCSLPKALSAPWSPSAGSSATLNKINFSTFLVKNNASTMQLRLQQLTDADVDEVRFDASWQAIEPKPCHFDFKATDAWMKGLAHHHIRALMIAGKTPDWASDDPNCARNDGKCAPRNPADYGRFVQALTSRYQNFKPDIELVNESEGIPAPIYAQMCGNAYPRIKQLSPNSTVLFGSKKATDPSEPYNPDRPANFFRDVMAVGGCQFDAISVHPYTDKVLPGDKSATGWQEMIELQKTASELGQAAKPIFITEFGSPYPQIQVQQFDAALHQIREQNLKSNSKITKMFIFTLQDPRPNFSYGAIDAQNNIRPLYDTVRVYNETH